MKNNKRFDCLKMKEKIQAKILKETKGMNDKALLEYYNSCIPNVRKKIA